MDETLRGETSTGKFSSNVLVIIFIQNLNAYWWVVQPKPRIKFYHIKYWILRIWANEVLNNDQ